MAYEIQDRKMYYVVLKGNEVHLKVYPTEKGSPPQRFGFANTGPDVEYTKKIAEQAVRWVRSQLPLGAFNNQMQICGKYKYLTNDISPKWLAARAETMYTALAFKGDEPRDTVTQMAARSLATRTVGGGVCSLLTYVTAGYLTTIAKRGTKIVTVFDSSFDHEYVVLYYGTSPYVVADPWVGTSYACLWDECYFPPNDVSVNTQMEIGETLTIPYGVEFSEREIEVAKTTAEISSIKKPPEKQLLDSSKQGLEVKDNYSWFHMDGVYGHPDNIQDIFRLNYKSVVSPDEWGDAVK